MTRKHNKRSNGTAYPGPGPVDKAQYLKDFETAKMLLQNKKPAECTQLLSKLLKQNPQDYGVLELLGVASANLKNYEAAIKFLKAVIERQPDKASARLLLGDVYVKSGQVEHGIDTLEHALPDAEKQLNPKELAEGYSNLGNAYMFRGRKDKAKTFMRKACDLDPENIEHLYNLVTQVSKIDSVSDKYFQQLKKLEKSLPEDLDTSQKAMLNFALFDCYDAVGEHEKAFDYALEANRHARSEFEWNKDHMDKLFSAIKRYFDASFFSEHENTGHPSSKPVFIVGMPRSGTTLLEQILHAHPEIEGIGEDGFMAYLIKHYSFFEPRNRQKYPLRADTGHREYLTPEQIGREYNEYIAKKAPNTARVVNKAISTMLFIGFIKIALPDAKFIHIRRNPMDSCISSFTKYFQDNAQRFTYDLEELGWYYTQYTALTDHWNTVLPSAIYNVTYEELVHDLEPKAREIIAFLNLEWDDSCLEFYKAESTVKTASLAQVRSPLYTSSIDRWKCYGPKVEPLLKALGIPPKE